MRKLQIKNNKISSYLLTIIIVAISTLIPKTAFAHHFSDDQEPNNIFEGFASGIFHPIIGIDHFVFMLAGAIIIIVCKTARITTPLFLVAGLITGVFIHVAEVQIPYIETFVIASAIIFGAILAFKIRFNIYQLAPIFVGASIFHGYALAEVIVGVYDTKVATFYAYLGGLAVIQYIICVAFALLFDKIAKKLDKKTLLLEQKIPKYIGIIICITGVIIAADIV